MQRHRAHAVTDRVVFNGHDLGELVSCTVQRPVMAPMVVECDTVPGRDGELFKAARLGAYDLPVDVWLRADKRRDVADVRHRLALMLYVEEPAPLYLPDDPSRYLLAVPSGETSLGEITDECPGATLTFRVVDPLYYGRKRKADVTTSGVYVQTGGDRPSWPIVAGTPEAGASWRISNLTTGEFVEVSATLTASSSVVLDMRAQKATVNGQIAPVTLDSDFFDIDGRTQLKVSSGSAVVEWRERWL